MADPHTSALPTVDNRISTGNMLTIIAAFLSAGIAYGAAQSDLRTMQSRLDAVELRIAQSAADRAAQLAGQEARVRALEGTTARDGARLDAILQSLARIEARLDRAESRTTGR